MRRMACSLTIAAVLDRSKTVTRRHVDTWKTLKPGDRLTLIEKGMGLAKGERQVALAEVEVVDVRVEPIWRICTETGAGTRAEGLAGMAAPEFVRFWMDSHGYRKVALASAPNEGPMCRRIAWRYADVPVGASPSEAAEAICDSVWAQRNQIVKSTGHPPRPDSVVVVRREFEFALRTSTLVSHPSGGPIVCPAEGPMRLFGFEVGWTDYSGHDDVRLVQDRTRL